MPPFVPPHMPPHIRPRRQPSGGRGATAASVATARNRCADRARAIVRNAHSTCRRMRACNAMPWNRLPPPLTPRVPVDPRCENARACGSRVSRRRVGRGRSCAKPGAPSWGDVESCRVRPPLARAVPERDAPPTRASHERSPAATNRPPWVARSRGAAQPHRLPDPQKEEGAVRAALPRPQASGDGCATPPHPRMGGIMDGDGQRGDACAVAGSAPCASRWRRSGVLSSEM
jgi:hypothetical protein